MKNIPVGKKMLLGFGVVILMIVLILTISVVTSTARNADIERVTTMSDLQKEANHMLDNFNLARVEIRTVFSSIYAEEEYYTALDYLNICGGHLDNMEALSTELGGYMYDDIATLRSMFASVESALLAVGDYDEATIAALDEMVGNGTVMSDSTTELANLVIKVILAIEDPSSAMERVENVIVPIIALNDDVAAVRIESRYLMLLQDAASIPRIYEGLDKVATSGAAIEKILTSDEAKAATRTLLTAVEGFRGSVGKVENIIAASDKEINAARSIFGSLATLVDDYVSTISGDVTVMHENVMQTSRTSMYVIAVAGVIASIFSVCVAIYLSRSITRPLAKMKSVMAQAGATGNLRFDEAVKEDIRKEGEARDELGQSLSAFAKFIDQITYMAECLEAIAHQDLSIDVRLLSDEDTMGKALLGMLDNFNEIFDEIGTVSKLLANASEEVAAGAQSLAQGSTEQAATVEQVSASIAAINDQMNLSSETASSAADHGSEINQIANDGNEKMRHMIESMTEINDASQAIGRVIKAIDDIAFQTNILALNAAVEAARAGQHGKGFAVVADEVRSLAAKSADSAKETADLISTNLVKTEQGLAYTHDTAESLEKIIEGIERTNTSLRQVAEQSQSTKAATAQVTSAIDQVSVVIQQNSATSEESAAASQQMSSQAKVLQEYISRFKLRDHRFPSGPRIAMPPMTAPEPEDASPPTYSATAKY
ncbi:methyl-accepting chemotaxis protein [Oscillospiraceae bacterium OttesenSCG-928-F05]|nr:methyl-accepting chemotaxis protein [Oscillospiraceae bacterium OttesenSCG-928-F05]